MLSLGLLCFAIAQRCFEGQEISGSQHDSKPTSSIVMLTLLSALLRKHLAQSADNAVWERRHYSFERCF